MDLDDHKMMSQTEEKQGRRQAPNARVIIMLRIRNGGGLEVLVMEMGLSPQLKSFWIVTQLERAEGDIDWESKYT